MRNVKVFPTPLPSGDTARLHRRPSSQPAPSDSSRSLRARLAWGLLAAVALVATPERSTQAAEMVAARASIRAVDARRHVAALADDAFEGREGGSRGGRAAGSYIVAQLEKLGLQPAGDNGGFYQQFGSMRNILALAPGTDPTVAEELIIVSAHYDHVGYGNAANSYGPFGFVHNGADDNASGVAGLLEVAEAMRHLPAATRRPILYAFWDGEEKGLLGSAHFVRVRPAILASKKIVFVLNLDMIGRLRGERLEVYGSRTAAGLRSAVVASNNRPGATPLELFFDWAIEEDSDHYTFIVAQVPTVMFHTGLHDQYHRPSDDVELVNFDGIEPVARLTLDFVTAVADAPGPPRPFRGQSRSETEAARKSLEAPAAAGQEAGAGPVAGGGRRPRWGIGTRADAAEPMAPLIVRVAPGSPAERAGLAVGDRVTTIDGMSIRDQADMLSRFAAAGSTVAVAVERKGRLLSVAMRCEDE
jgi:hypothetical protein